MEYDQLIELFFLIPKMYIMLTFSFEDNGIVI